MSGISSSDQFIIKIFEDIDENQRGLQPDDFFRDYAPKIECCKIIFPPKLVSINIVDKLIQDNDTYAHYLAMQWLKEYDFHLVEFSCTLDVNQYYMIKDLEIRLEINPSDEFERPVALHLFPTRVFEKSRHSLDIEIGASLGVDFAKILDLSDTKTQLGGNIIYKYKYNPRICVIEAGGINTSRIFWKISEYDGIAPTGDMITWFILKRPRKNTKLSIKVQVNTISIRKGIRNLFSGKILREWDGIIPIEYRTSTINFKQDRLLNNR